MIIRVEGTYNNARGVAEAVEYLADEIGLTRLQIHLLLIGDPELILIEIA